MAAAKDPKEQLQGRDNYTDGVRFFRSRAPRITALRSTDIARPLSYPPLTRWRIRITPLP